MSGWRALERPYPLAGREGGSALRRLLPILRPYRLLLAVAVLLGALHQTALLASAGYSARLAGLAATAASPADAAPADFGSGMAVLLTLVLVAGALAWARLYFEYELAHRILAELRLWLYQAFERLAPASLAGRRSGELVATATADIARVDWFFARLLPAVATALLVPLLALGFLAWLHPRLALALAPFVLLVAAAPFLFRRRALAQGEALRAAQAEINSETLEAVEGLREILAFGQGDAFVERLDRRGRELRRAQLAYGLREGGELAVTGALTSAGMLTVFLLAARLVSRGELAAEHLPVAVLLATAFFAPILAATGAAARLGLVAGSAARVFELLEQRPRVADSPGVAPPEDEAAGARPALTFEDVSFRYDPQRPEVLRGASFTVRPGETVALAGASGAGKSTCLHLLLRFWDPDGGRILYAGHDLRRLPLAWLRRQIAWVPQDGYLFDDTVAANLRLGRPQASDAELEAAARAAQAHEFVTALPEGYATQLGERGVRLSGGQRQRLLIARALLQEAPLLVMDEAVANLDGENEQAFGEALATFGGGRSVLLVAHRWSTLRAADRIVVLDGGRIVEDGAHETLLAAGGAYARIVADRERGGAPGGEPV